MHQLMPERQRHMRRMQLLEHARAQHAAIQVQVDQLDRAYGHHGQMVLRHFNELNPFAPIPPQQQTPAAPLVTAFGQGHQQTPVYPSDQTNVYFRGPQQTPTGNMGRAQSQVHRWPLLANGRIATADNQPYDMSRPMNLGQAMPNPYAGYASPPRQATGSAPDPGQGFAYGVSALAQQAPGQVPYFQSSSASRQPPQYLSPYADFNQPYPRGRPQENAVTAAHTVPSDNSQVNVRPSAQPESGRDTSGRLRRYFPQP